jgi:Domain of unknown function (DUF222)/HNH endonuclease
VFETDGELAPAVAVVDRVLATPAATVPVAVLADRLREIALMEARLSALKLDTVAAFDAQGGCVADLAQSTAVWLEQQLRMRAGAARVLVHTARELRHLPATAGALADGRITEAHVVAMTGVIRGGTAGAVRRRIAEGEDILLDLARTDAPEQVAVAARRLRDLADPEETAQARAERQRAERYLTCVRTFDGCYDVQGRLDPADGALFEAALTAVSRPVPGPDGSPDERTAGMRRADGLHEIVASYLARPDTPTVAGRTASVVLVTDLPGLQAGLKRGLAGAPADGADPADLGGRSLAVRAAVAATVAGPFATLVAGSLGPGALERLTCCPEVSVAVVDGLGVPLALGREERLASRDIVRALWLRDGGCLGCGSKHVQAHHVVHWADGGNTSVANMCLLCSRCHHLVHEEGWVLECDPNRPGLFRWRPPGGGPPVPAAHTIDRNRGQWLELPLPGDAA